MSFKISLVSGGCTNKIEEVLCVIFQNNGNTSFGMERVLVGGFETGILVLN